MMDSRSLDKQIQSDIRIDRDGVWHFRGAEMIRKDIIRLFYQHLRKDEAGRFLIELQDDRSYIEVEDVPYAVRSVTRVLDGQGGVSSYLLQLNDDTIEELDPQTLRIGEGNILYSSVREGLFEAKFSRAAYYQIANLMEYDSESDLFYLVQNGLKFTVRPKD